MCGPGHNHGQDHQGDASTSVQPAPASAVAKPCPQCGSPVQEDFVFCPRCGAELLTACPECHRAVETGWTHCAFCGAELVKA